VDAGEHGAGRLRLIDPRQRRHTPVTYPLQPLTGRYWRMLGVRWQRRPLESGSHLTGGRWNPPGQPALYLSADYNTAIREMHQDLIRPGTLAAYDVSATRIADLLSLDAAVTHCLWRQLYKVEGRVPPTWPLVEQLVAAGAEGALVPSVAHRGGVNLVLWRWSAAGEGAALTVLDPEAVLGGAPR
jgi:RES domain-containing protein